MSLTKTEKKKIINDVIFDLCNYDENLMESYETYGDKIFQGNETMEIVFNLLESIDCKKLLFKTLDKLLIEYREEK